MFTGVKEFVCTYSWNTLCKYNSAIIPFPSTKIFTELTEQIKKPILYLSIITLNRLRESFLKKSLSGWVGLM